jgi:metal-responsive CopG/Arc/MetJ family transcriptional regulator
VTAIRLPSEMLAAIDAWAARQPSWPGRSEAMRRLIEIGLKAKGK